MSEIGHNSDGAEPDAPAAEILLDIVERFEACEDEKRKLRVEQSTMMAEAKGQGFDTKVIRKVIALRKRNPDDVAEEEALLETYKAALGMA